MIDIIQTMIVAKVQGSPWWLTHLYVLLIGLLAGITLTRRMLKPSMRDLAQAVADSNEAMEKMNADLVRWRDALRKDWRNASSLKRRGVSDGQ